MHYLTNTHINKLQDKYIMIEIKNLGFAYGQKIVLQNITTFLEPGKIYGLLGENGVGKTTLLTLLCGLKKPQEGKIITDGREPYERFPSFLQEQYYLPDEVPGYRTKALDFAKYNGKFWPLFSLEKFCTIMKEFENDCEQNMNRMSAGQLKKTYIAFALACNTRYLFMDEPTNGLDIPSKALFRKALMTHTCEDSTIVISTHQVRDLENVIDPIIILDKQDVLLNSDIKTISEKLFFDYGTTLHPDALYSEQLPGSYVQVLVNADGRESKVNIEALFNAAHRHKGFIKEMFNK